MNTVTLSFAVVALLCAASPPPASISKGTESKIVVTDFRPGQAFRDCPNCPEMVVQAGTFTMASLTIDGGYVA
jgi:hypothetical protein